MSLRSIEIRKAYFDRNSDPSLVAIVNVSARVIGYETEEVIDG
jgi:hypothetical protein